MGCQAQREPVVAEHDVRMMVALSQQRHLCGQSERLGKAAEGSPLGQPIRLERPAVEFFQRALNLLRRQLGHLDLHQQFRM